MSRILNKIITFLRNLLWTDYDICYEEMESRGIAVFGNCCGMYGGDKNTDYLSYTCVDCPHLVLGCKPYKKEEEPCITKEFAEECKEVAKKYEKPKTNADRIRNMTDEELAYLLNNDDFCDEAQKTVGCIPSCYECTLRWLQAEVKEGAEDEQWEEFCRKHEGEDDGRTQ